MFCSPVPSEFITMMSDGILVLRSQTSPLSAGHIAGVKVAEKSGVERTRNRYLRDFMLIAAPISCHAKSAYVSQGLWRGLFDHTWRTRSSSHLETSLDAVWYTSCRL
jgi:hypothetical protein